MMVKKITDLRSALSLSAALSAAGALVALAYAAFAVFPLASGPHLSATATFDSARGTTIIAGSAPRVSRLSINGLEVPVSEDGAFSIERAFPLGYTVVDIAASDRFGRSRETILTFVTAHEHASKKEITSRDAPESSGEGSGETVENGFN